MPRIDPLQLLKCLSVLLAPHGGIKSPEDVARLVSLMSKFSKKLVSKCIYVQILQATSSELLAQFMRDGGWDLVSTWVMEAITLSNGPLLEQLLELTLRSPLDLVQLQINACPRTVKALTRDAPTQRVRELAVMVVDSWVQMAREGLIKPAEAQPVHNFSAPTSTVSMIQETITIPTLQDSLLLQQQQQSQLQQYVKVEQIKQELMKEEAMHVDIKPYETVVVNTKLEVKPEVLKEEVLQDVEMMEVPVVDEGEEEMHENEEEQEEEETGGSAEENDGWDAPLGQLPVYKITIRDGKQVLAKVYSGDRPPKTATNTVVINVPQEQPEVVAPVEVVVADAPKPEPPKKEGPRGAARRKQQLKPSTDAEAPPLAPPEMSEAEKKKVAAQEKISARLAKEQAAKRAERLLREKQAKLREKLAEREAKEKERRAKVQEEKDQATLARLMGPSKVGLGKIPKKSRSEDEKKSTSTEERKSELRRNSSEDEKKRDRSSKLDSKSESRKDKDDSKKASSSTKNDPKKDPSKSPKNSTASTNGSTASSNSSSSSKSKVKTFTSKPRSTGLEETPPPPPPRGQTKKDKDSKDKRAPLLSLSKKRSPPPPSKDQTPPDKKPKPNPVEEEEEETAKKSPAPPKPKPKPAVKLIQESDFFMDALTAVTRPEPRKRKRRVSSSKDEPPSNQAAAGKPGSKEPESPSESPKKSMSPTSASRPSFQFYTDTLETSKSVDESEEVNPSDRTPTPPGDGGEEESKGSSEGSNKGVLVLHRPAERVKKSVRFRVEEELVSILYFELDETERVNVTKTFGDLRLLDLEHERDMMQNAKKLAITQEEKIPWRRLIPIDAPPPLVEPGKNSRERDVQFAREKTVLQAIYFTPGSIPDYPAEPDPESHPTTDPKVIPQDDTTGNPDSVKDFSNAPWPEPKIGHAPTPSFVTHSVPFTPSPAVQPVPAPVGGGGGWRTGDGQVLSAGPGEVFPPSNNNFAPPHAGYETGSQVPYGGYGYETPGGYMDGMNYGGSPDMNNGPPMGGSPNNFLYPPPQGPGNFRPQGPGNWGPPIGPMGEPPGHMGGPQGPMGGPQRPMGGPMNSPQGHMGHPGLMGGSQGPMGGPMVGPQGPMGGPGHMGHQGPMGGPQGPMGGPQGPMGGPQGPMGGPQGPMGGPQGPMGGPQGPMGGHQGPMGGPGHNEMRGGGQRFRGGGPRGGRGNWNNGPSRGGRGKGWGGGGGNRGVCKHFRSGYCRNGDNCNFLHPGSGPNF